MQAIAETIPTAPVQQQPRLMGHKPTDVIPFVGSTSIHVDRNLRTLARVILESQI